MVAYQQRGEGVMVKFRTPGEVLRWGGIGTEVEWVEEAATHFMVWLEEGVLCGSGGGMLPPGDFQLNEIGRIKSHHRHKEKPILLRSGRAKKEEELRNALAEELAERATRTSEDISATPKEVDWFWAVWGLLTLGGVLWRGQQSKGTALGSRVAAQLSESLPEEVEDPCNTAEVTSRR